MIKVKFFLTIVNEMGRWCKNCLTFLEVTNERLWPPSRIMIGLHFSSQQPGTDE